MRVSITKITALNKQPRVKKAIAALAKAGGRVLLVGGAVRDLLLGLPIKDLDIEIHGLSLDQVERVLKTCGKVSLVGKIYGVFRLHGVDVDWSVPRTETAGRKPKVTVDPKLSFKQAFARRDLTINAMGIDLVTSELIDPYGGQKDLKKKILRATSPRFVEDPLRFYRVLQFMARFEMKPDQKLTKICKSMDVKNLSVERIEQEFKKLLLQSKRPSIAFRWLKEIGRLDELLPELGATVGVVQPKRWHPEGDVFEHSLQSLDAMSTVRMDSIHFLQGKKHSPRTEGESLVLMYSALLHDLGKSVTTTVKDGEIHAYGHAEAGVPLAKKLLSRIVRNNDLVAAVCKLVRYHLAPLEFKIGGAKPAAYKRLAVKLAPEVTIADVALVSLSDRRGRNGKSSRPLRKQDKDVTEFLRMAQEAQVTHEPEPPVLHGRDLLDVVKPGKELGELLKRAYEIQISEGIKDKKVLRDLTLAVRGE